MEAVARARFSGPVPYAFSSGQAPAGQMWIRPIHPVHRNAVASSMVSRLPSFARPGGQIGFGTSGSYDPFGITTALGQVSDTGTTGGKTPTEAYGQLPSNTQMGLNFAASALGMAAQTIVGIVQSNNQREVAQLQAQTLLEIQRLRGTSGLSTDETSQLQALQALNTQLQAQLAMQQAPQTNWPLYIALGAGGLLIVGAFAYFMAGRSRTARANPVVIHHGKKRFVPASRLNKPRRRSKSKSRNRAA